ncbi:MAG: hypothetical protein P4L62_01060 [Candidatus Pacebacteria bacterium]|nr:hypothetical protein [Candidatus Paceibacterota bacterium]MDR3582936.1 hypothetical protein [Candidatus Paceibacterota bacterium]
MQTLAEKIKLFCIRYWDLDDEAFYQKFLEEGEALGWNFEGIINYLKPHWPKVAEKIQDELDFVYNNL